MIPRIVEDTYSSHTEIEMIRILIPMDFSKEAYLAFDWGVRLAAQKKDCFLELFHAVPIGRGQSEATALEKARGLMEEFRKTIPSDIPVRVWVRSGRVPEEIANFCRAETIDLVIMTTRGRLGAARQIEGSITEETVRLTPSPVLVLHLNKATAEQVARRFEGFLPASDSGPLL